MSRLWRRLADVVNGERAIAAHSSKTACKRRQVVFPETYRELIISDAEMQRNSKQESPEDCQLLRKDYPMR
jgi:hypothetical protein